MNISYRKVANNLFCVALGAVVTYLLITELTPDPTMQSLSYNACGYVDGGETGIINFEDSSILVICKDGSANFLR